MMNISINIKNIEKDYYINLNVYNKIKHFLGMKLDNVQKKKALKNITFSVKKGESVGIIGKNGSGKSTLLQIISKTLKPTKGACDISGRVSALLELGSGFNPDYTGYENIIINGLLIGLTKSEILSKIKEIHDYSGIGNSLYLPVKTYSTGMVVRLAFSVLIHCDPDILVIDEALSVGDFFFQQKCLSSVRKLQEKGVILLFVSHDMGAVREVCSRGLYLKDGNLEYDGPIEKACWHYFNSGEKSDNPAKVNINTSADSSTKGEIKSVKVLNLSEEEVDSIRMGDYLIFQVDFSHTEKKRVDISLTLKNRFGAHCTSMNTLDLEDNAFVKINGYINRVNFKVKMLVEAGEYSIDAYLGITSASNFGTPIDAKEKIGPIRITWDYEKNIAPFTGMFGLPVEKENIVLEQND